MMEQTATVVDIRSGQLVLEVQPETSCNSCSVNKGCGTSVLSQSVGRKVIHFELDNTLNAAIGDRVVLGVPEDAVVKGSLLIYLLPLVLMFVVALLADQLIALGDNLRDIKIAVLSLMALTGSVILGRKLVQPSGSAYQPVLLRKAISVSVGAEPGRPS